MKCANIALLPQIFLLLYIYLTHPPQPRFFVAPTLQSDLERRLWIKFCSFRVFSIFLLGGTLHPQRGERTRKQRSFSARSSSLGSPPLKAFLSCFFSPPTFLHLAVGRRPDESAVDGDFQRDCGHPS